MKLKVFTLTAFACLAAYVTLAYVVFEFKDWDTLNSKSREFFIARCLSTPDPLKPDKNGIAKELKGLLNSEMEIILPMKGTNQPGTNIINSEYWPRQGETYLKFSNPGYGCYQATESYRVIPLGIYFPTNLLSGKTFDQKIEAIFRYRLYALSQQIKEELEEKNVWRKD